MPFSVLMSLYYKENPCFLDKSLCSIFNQTMQADEVVLVEDGPLTPELISIVDKYKSAYNELKLVKIVENGGLGKALNEGLRYCSNDLIVRADTDDICKPERFERQVSFMENHPEIDVCSACIDEFVDNIDHIVSTRSLPENHEDIYRFGKRRNPINHPVSVFRKSAVEAVGSYQHFNLFEDYYLWVRMIMNGSKFHNINESLLYFRYSPQMMRRRGGWKYASVEMKFQYKLYNIGYISLPIMIENIIARFGVRLIPNRLRSWIYMNFLRETTKD